MAELTDLIGEESPIDQGILEKRTYRVRFDSTPTLDTDWSVKAYDNGENDVTTTVMPAGSPSVSGFDIVWPRLQALDVSASPYRVITRATVQGDSLTVTTIFNAKDEKTLK